MNARAAIEITDALERWARALAQPDLTHALSNPRGIVEALHAHGLAAAIAQSLHDTPHWQALDADTAQNLRACARQLSARELAWTAPLARSLQALSDAGIAVLVIKGEALARTLYPMPGMRERCDVDLWVRAGQFEHAAQALVDLGLTAQVSATGEWSLPERAFLGGADSGGLILDLHQRLFGQPLLARALDFDEVYAAGDGLPGLAARAPRAAHALLIAVLHRVAHHGDQSERLIWLYDIDLLVRRFPDELQVAAQLAIERGVAGLLEAALHRTATVFGTPLPAGLVDMLARRAPHERAQRLLAPMSPLARRWFDFVTLPDFRARWRWLVELIAPSREYMMQRHAGSRRWMLPWLYVRRAAGGIRKLRR